MSKFGPNSKRGLRWIACMLTAAMLTAPVALYAGKKKKDAAPAAPQEKSILERLDYSKIVWPNPPAITRVKFLTWYAAMKPDPSTLPGAKKSAKSSWMERLAGAENTTQSTADKPLFQHWTPYGLAVDSKGKLYVADGKVGAVFIWNTETKDLELIKNGTNAKFGLIMGLAMDDNDRLFVSDSQLHRVLVFNPQHKQEAIISEGMVDPGGMAIDTENRFLYVADAALDQILVYDADKFNLIRRIGTTGKNHTLTNPGDFAKPTNVAVDKDGNVYVADTMNNRIEIFDADGNFIRAWGKHGDGPGHFARPKGVAIDSDGHVWVADAVQDRLQCFTPEGKMLMYMGGHGLLPGQFRDLAGVTIDKNNRIFTSEQFPGRVQGFRYIPDPDAQAEWDRRQAEKAGGAKAKEAASAPASAAPPAATAETKSPGSSSK